MDEGDGRRARRRLLFHNAIRIVETLGVSLPRYWNEHYDGLGSSALDQAVKVIDDACTPGRRHRLTGSSQRSAIRPCLTPLVHPFRDEP